jgi:inosine/xanthosine triphosphatase
MLKIAVGSKNPVKIEAVKSGFEKVFGNCEIIGVSVPSQVSEMPMSFSEISQGAKNRALGALKLLKADYGVGLEGGFNKTELGTFLSGFVAIVNKDGIWGYAGGEGLFMPEKIVTKVKLEKKELGDVMDEIRGLKNTKQQEGCVGYFTNNLIDRKESFEKPVICALSRFSKSEMFE